MLYQNDRGQSIGGLALMVANPVAASPVRAFQFRLGTLLIATTWAGLVSLGLRTPTPLWSGVIAVLTLLTVLMSVLFLIYRTGRTRAMAIGFLVFCVGYLAYLAVLAGTLSNGLSSDATPVGGAFGLIFEIIHPPQDASGGFGGGLGGVRTWVQRFNEGDFVAICNNALACLLGVAGSIAAQIMYSTQRSESRQNLGA